MNITYDQAGSLGIAPGFALNLCMNMGKLFPVLGLSCSTLNTDATAIIKAIAGLLPLMSAVVSSRASMKGIIQVCLFFSLH